MHTLSNEALDRFTENVVSEITNDYSPALLEAFHKRAPKGLSQKAETCSSWSAATRWGDALVSLVESDLKSLPTLNAQIDAQRHGRLLRLAQESKPAASEQWNEVMEELITALRKPEFEPFVRLEKKLKKEEPLSVEEEKSLREAEKHFLPTEARLAIELMQEKSVKELLRDQFTIDFKKDLSGWTTLAKLAGKTDEQLKFEMNWAVNHMKMPLPTSGASLQEQLRITFRQRYRPQLMEEVAEKKEAFRQAVRENPERTFAALKLFAQGGRLQFFSEETIKELGAQGLDKPSFGDRFSGVIKWMQRSKKPSVAPAQAKPTGLAID